MKTSLECTGQNLFRTVEKSWKKIKPFGHSRAPKKDATFWPFSPSWWIWPIWKHCCYQISFEGRRLLWPASRSRGGGSTKVPRALPPLFQPPTKTLHQNISLNCACSGVSFVSFFWLVDFMRKLSWGRRGSAGWQLECWSSRSFQAAAGRGKLWGDKQGVSEGRGACQAADCRREKQEREREDSPLTEKEKQNTGEFHNRLLKLFESRVLFWFPEKTRLRFLPRGWLAFGQKWSQALKMPSPDTLSQPQVYSSAIFDANCQPMWIIGCPRTWIPCLNCHVRQNTDHVNGYFTIFCQIQMFEFGQTNSVDPPSLIWFKRGKKHHLFSTISISIPFHTVAMLECTTFVERKKWNTFDVISKYKMSLP